MTFYSVPLQKGQSAELRPKALTLMLAAGFILLIACANLAGLTLVRMARRTPEMATRLALGASRWQIQKQLWVENLLLAGGRTRPAWPWVLLLCAACFRCLPETFSQWPVCRWMAACWPSRWLSALFTSVLFGMLPALAVAQGRPAPSIPAAP